MSRKVLNIKASESHERARRTAGLSGKGKTRYKHLMNLVVSVNLAVGEFYQG
jgi:hypothetical protein